MIAYLLAAGLAAAQAEAAPAPVSEMQRTYSAWGDCLNERLAVDRYASASRIADRAMGACLSFENAYSRAQQQWLASANPNEAQRREAERNFQRSVRRMRRMIEATAQEMQDQSGNR